jgi:uncharacterized repeat protein (TIGR04076 family)
MPLYRVLVEVVEVRGRCAAGYKPDVRIVLEGFYIVSRESSNVCMHAFSALLSLLSAFAHGASARDLGVGSSYDEGYLQCPDPGKPYTCGGTVIFRLKRTDKVE